MAKRILILAIVLLSFSFAPFNTPTKQKAEIVYCIDLSASTNGLLNDIRDNLWYFINRARINRPETDLRIGIVGFARPSFGAENHYIKVLCDITENYDLVSYSLFQLKVNVEKGDQCDGSALYMALNGMNWDMNPLIKKTIYLFGNGIVDVCGYDYRKACDIAVKKNIPVNAIYCVQRAIVSKELRGWHEIASATGGEFHTLQITKRTPLKKFSGDAQWLVNLNQKLRETYIYFGKDGRKRYEMMCAADENSAKMNEEFFYARSMYKLSNHYEVQSGEWDLVSLLKINSPDFSQLDRSFLPEEFQNTNANDLKAAAMIKKGRRDFLLGKLRSAFVILARETGYANPADSIFSSGL